MFKELFNGEDPEELANTYNSIGYVYQDKWDFKTALGYLNKALEKWEEISLIYLKCMKSCWHFLIKLVYPYNRLLISSLFIQPHINFHWFLLFTIISLNFFIKSWNKTTKTKNVWQYFQIKEALLWNNENMTPLDLVASIGGLLGKCFFLDLKLVF